MEVTNKQLKTMAFIFWFMGVLPLSIKAFLLFREAYLLDSDILKLSFYIFLGIIVALLKTKFIFIKSCRKNIQRIENLEKPKIWNFYRLGFFIFLATVIILGAVFSRLALGHYWALILVGIIDMSVGFALLLSGWLCKKESRQR